MSFEQDLARLDVIARALENDRLALDDALKLFEEGVARLRSAAVALEAAEGRVQQLVEQADGTVALREMNETLEKRERHERGEAGKISGDTLRGCGVDG